MRLHGILLKESLADDGPLDLVKVVSVTMSRVEDSVPPQPKWWTEVRFEAEAEHADEIAKSFSAALKPAAWYLHYWTDSHVFIVFPGKIFKYAKGSKSHTEEAVAYGLSIGVPRHQLEERTSSELPPMGGRVDERA